MGEDQQHHQGQTRGERQAENQEQQKTAGDESSFPDLKPGDAWGDSITKKRAAELEEMLKTWEMQGEEHGGRGGPFDGVRLSGADVSWLAVRVLAGTGTHQTVAAGMDQHWPMQERTIVPNRLNLSGADLRGADLRGANLGHAELIRANLTRAKLVGANLAGASLSYSRVDSVGILGEVIIDSGVDLSDVFWNDMPEPRDSTVGTREEQAVSCRDAARVHRHARRVLRDQGLVRLASEYRLREEHMERQALWKERKLGSWLFSWFLDLVSGYGERLGRILAAYGVTLLVFTALYWLMGVHSFRHESGIQAFGDSFLVSLSAIHGRTTFEQLGAWSPAAWTAAVESVFGIVMEGVFVAMLVQRFFAR